MGFYVLGDEELVAGFQFVGVGGSVVNSREEGIPAFKSATAILDLHVLIITEQVSAMLEQEVTDWQLVGNYPLIVEIPGLHGHLENRKTLLESVREAIGISV